MRRLLFKSGPARSGRVQRLRATKSQSRVLPGTTNANLATPTAGFFCVRAAGAERRRGHRRAAAMAGAGPSPGLAALGSQRRVCRSAAVACGPDESFEEVPRDR